MSAEMEIYIKLLSLAKCFKGFELNNLRDLLSISSKAIWQANENAFDEGSQGRNMYIICSGMMNIWRNNGGKKMSLANLSEGESFGEMGLIRGGVRSAGATALEETVALCINYERLNQAPTAAALLYKNIAKELAERLKIANDVIVFQSKSGAKSPPLLTLGRRQKGKRS